MKTETYSRMHEYLKGARNRDNGRPLANNTRIFDRGEDVLAVRLHNTDIVTMHPDGRVTLDSGGWLTITTRSRMNDYAPNVRVWTKDHEWFVTIFGRGTVPYFNGMTFDRDGNVLNGPSPEQWEKYESLRKERRKLLTKYLRTVKKELRSGDLTMPGPGDCWYCGLLNNAVDDNSHLVSHMEEGYVVPSLLVNALREAGYSDSGIYLFLNMDPENNRMGSKRESDYSLVLRAVRKYMHKRIVPNPPTA